MVQRVRASSRSVCGPVGLPGQEVSELDRWSTAVARVAEDDAEGLKAFLAEGAATEGQDTLAGLLLVQAIEERASKCFEALLSVPEAVELGGGEALGAAARVGSLAWTQRLLDAGVGFDEPPHDPESDSDHALVGAMLSMNPTITAAVCSAGALLESDPGWIDDALNIALTSKVRSRWECMAILAEHLTRHTDTVIPTLDAKIVQAFGRRVADSKKLPAETRALGQRLAAAVDQNEALHDTLLERIFDGEYSQALEILEAAPTDSRAAWSSEALAWIAGACYADEEEHGSALWAVDRLMAQGVALDAVDSYGRTALINLVWETQGLESLVRRMVEQGADVNAIHTDHNEKASVGARLHGQERGAWHVRRICFEASGPSPPARWTPRRRVALLGFSYGMTPNKSTNPFRYLPLVDMPTAYEMGFALATWQRVVDAAPGSFGRLALQGFIDTNASVEIGARRPMPEDPAFEHYSLDVAAIVVPTAEAFRIADEMATAVGPGAQVLVTSHGTKDFVHLFETGWISASEMASAGEILVVFPGDSYEPMLWARQTNAANSDMGTAEIIERLRRLEADYGSRVVGAGWDWVQVDFVHVPENRRALAEELIDFCYDLAEEFVPDDELDDDEYDFEDCARASDDVSAAALSVGIIRGMTLLSEIAEAIFEGTDASSEPLSPADFGDDEDLMHEILEKLRRAPDDTGAAEELFIALSRHSNTIDPARLVAALGNEAFQWMFENFDETMENTTVDRSDEDEAAEDERFERRAAEALAEHLKENRSIFLWWD